MNKFELPDNLEMAKLVVTDKRQTRQLEMGAIGRIFGTLDEKPGNIAGAAIIVCFLIIVAVLFFLPESDTQKSEIILVFTGIITLALGYVFGRGSKPDSQS